MYLYCSSSHINSSPPCSPWSKHRLQQLCGGRLPQEGKIKRNIIHATTETNRTPQTNINKWDQRTYVSDIIHMIRWASGNRNRGDSVIPTRNRQDKQTTSKPNSKKGWKRRKNIRNKKQESKRKESTQGEYAEDFAGSQAAWGECGHRDKITKSAKNSEEGDTGNKRKTKKRKGRGK